MTAVRPLRMPASSKAVLLALADYADELGRCYPSIPKLCEFTCLCERAVHGAIKWLEQHRAIQCDRSNGRHTTYLVTPAAYAGADGSKPPQQMRPRSRCAPAADAPTPAGNAVLPPQQMQSPPQQMRSNHQEPLIEPPITTRASDPPKAVVLELPEWLPRTEWRAFVEMRKRIRKPMTDHAAKLLIEKLDQLRLSGNDPGKVLDQSTMSSWQSVFELKAAPSSVGQKRISGVHIGPQAYGTGWGK